MEDEIFSAAYQVAWGDLDANVHMANVAYFNYAAQTRFLYLESAGFGPQAFAEHAIGPVVREETIRYRKELRFLDRFRVEMLAGGLSEDGSRFRLINRFRREGGAVCAEVETIGAWFDLRARRVTTPPPTLRAAMEAMARTRDFAVLPARGGAPGGEPRSDCRQ